MGKRRRCGLPIRDTADCQSALRGIADLGPQTAATAGWSESPSFLRIMCRPSKSRSTPRIMHAVAFGRLGKTGRVGASAFSIIATGEELGMLNSPRADARLALR